MSIWKDGGHLLRWKRTTRRAALVGSRGSALAVHNCEMPHPSGDVEGAVRHAWRTGERSRLEIGVCFASTRIVVRTQDAMKSLIGEKRKEKRPEPRGSTQTKKMLPCR